MPEKRKVTKKREMEIITPTKKIMPAVKCDSIYQSYIIFKSLLDYEEYELKSQEHFWVMGIDAENYVACVYIAAIGADNMAIIDLLDVFSKAISHKSKFIILAHNHPAGLLPTSTEADIDLTNRLYHACLHFGLKILDHIILSDDDFFSMLINGDMKDIFASRKYKSYYRIKPQLDKEKKKAVKEGRLEEKIAMAKNLLKLNLDIKDIIKVTGLSKKAIEKLK